jgi:phosphoribulokinase
VINLKSIQERHRDTSLRGSSTEAVTDTILRRDLDLVPFELAETGEGAQRVVVVVKN